MLTRMSIDFEEYEKLRDVVQTLQRRLGEAVQLLDDQIARREEVERQLSRVRAALSKYEKEASK